MKILVRNFSFGFGFTGLFCYFAFWLVNIPVNYSAFIVIAIIGGIISKIHFHLK